MLLLLFKYNSFDRIISSTNVASVCWSILKYCFSVQSVNDKCRSSFRYFKLVLYLIVLDLLLKTGFKLSLSHFVL